ncbi:MAG TPA: DUF2628 domain-containing protein [Acetobacteraceae bacterium]|nr:DUF2628 domain-containing protein [Acetobacteraceae bacterium]
MSIWTVHQRGTAPPVLLREGASLGAAVFGPLWLAAHRAWVAAGLDLAAGILIVALARGWVLGVLLAAAVVLQGLFGRDLVRLSLAWHGWELDGVVAARGIDGAWARLLAGRPDLGSRLRP